MFKRLFVILLTAISLCMAVVSKPILAYAPFPIDGLDHNRYDLEKHTLMYSYAPYTVYFNGAFHQFYCSNGQDSDRFYPLKEKIFYSDASGEVNGGYRPWDQIRYRTSKDGVNWSAPRVVLSVTEGYDEACACDPSVVYGDDGYWYMLYDGNIPGKKAGNKPRYGTVVYLARSNFIQGPYFKYTENGKWENESGHASKPKMMLGRVTPTVVATNSEGKTETVEPYGTGQQTIVKDPKGSGFFVWFRSSKWKQVGSANGIPEDDNLKVVHVNSLTELPSAEWRNIYYGKNISFHGGEKYYDLGDVRYNEDKKRYELWCVDGYNQEKINVVKFTSKDGYAWQKENGAVIGPYNYIKNMGVSGDLHGWNKNGRYIVSFSGPQFGETDVSGVAFGKTADELKAYGYNILNQNAQVPLNGGIWPMWQVLVGGNWYSNTITYDADGTTFPEGSGVGRNDEIEYFTGDYDGDGIADLGAVDRSKTPNTWFIRSGRTGGYLVQGEALVDDMDENFEIITGDFDGDGKTDVGAVNRATSAWYIRSSADKNDNGVYAEMGKRGVGYSPNKPNWIPWGWQWGGMGSGHKIVVADYNGDGISDRAIYANYEPALNGRRWFLISSQATEYTVANGLSNVYGTTFIEWGWVWPGMTESFVAVSGDFDGDGIFDRAIYGMGNGKWFIYSSRVPQSKSAAVWYWDWKRDVSQWNNSTVMWNFRPFSSYQNTKPFVGDYDGDGVDDLVQVDFSDGRWYIYRSSDHKKTFFDDNPTLWVKFKEAKKPEVLVGDFDGDGRADRAFADKQTHKFYVISSRKKSWGVEGVNVEVKSAFENNASKSWLSFRKSAAEKPIEEPKAAPVVSKAPSMNVAVDGKKVTVTNVEYGSKVAVFDMLGKSVLEAPAGMNAATFEVPTYGKYIVRAGAQSRVIMVK